MIVLCFACTCRPQCQLAIKAGKFYTSVTNVAIWGNHSTTQVGAGGECGHACDSSCLVAVQLSATLAEWQPCTQPCIQAVGCSWLPHPSS